MDGGADEELPESRRSARRLRIDLAVGAVLLIGAAAAGKAIANDHGTPAGGTSSHASSSAPVTPPPSGTDFVTVGPGYLPAGRSSAVTTDARGHCPDNFQCIIARQPTQAAREALLAAYPTAQISSAQTTWIYVRNYGRALWFADLHARAGDAEITLRMRAHRASDQVDYQLRRLDGRSISRWESDLLQFHVLIQVVSPADRPASRDTIRQLAGDARLLDPY